MGVRQVVIGGSLAAALALGLACGASKSTPATNTTASAVRGSTGAAVATPPASGAVSAEVASSELVVGQNRFTLGLLDSTGTPIADATAHFTFFDLNGPQPVAKSQVDGTFRAPAREAGLKETVTVTEPNGQTRTQLNAPSDVGVYEATASFDRTGKWGVEADGQLKSGSSYTARTSFDVVATSSTPAIGSPAPRSHNLTVKDVTDLSTIDSSAVPSADMHMESIADGIAAGHALLILFATPGYCTSRFCGPELELARKLEPQYTGKVDFIHVEVYKDPAQRITSDAFNDYHLPSEPWFFIVDRTGIVRAKFEGPTTTEELTVALQQVAQ